jgi:hypothetical protein
MTGNPEVNPVWTENGHLGHLIAERELSALLN